MATRPLIQSREPNKSGAPGAMPRILIVDGDMGAADALALLLQSAGYGDARVVYTGATALTLAVEFVPTVVLLDLELPDMSGYEVARHLSQHPQLPNLRLVALTAKSEHPGSELAREARIERYLIKPIGSAELDELFTRSTEAEGSSADAGTPRGGPAPSTPQRPSVNATE
jgi:CheY-like chemotaxis protein